MLTANILNNVRAFIGKEVKGALPNVGKLYFIWKITNIVILFVEAFQISPPSVQVTNNEYQKSEVCNQRRI